MSRGLDACREALDRLLQANPVVPRHVGLNTCDITASIVSVEAGFDKGYLKKSRQSHLPIIAKIEACRNAAGERRVDGAALDRRYKQKFEKIERRAILAENQRDLVLVQNLQLWERIKELEKSVGITEPRLITSQVAGDASVSNG